MNSFEYIRPATVAEAIALSTQCNAAFLAGGNDLLDLMKGGVSSPSRLVDISRLPGLDRIEVMPDGTIRIGALVRNSDLAYHPEIDLGLEDNLMWNLSHWKTPLFRSTPFDGPVGTHLRNHATLFSFLMAPVYRLAPGAETLLVIQAVLMGAAAIPLHLFARRRLPPWLATLVAFLYLLYPPLHGANLYDFHYLPLGVVFLWTVLYAVDARRWVLAVVAALVAISVREDVAFCVGVLGVLLLVIDEVPWFGLALAVVAGGYFLLMKLAIMPHFGIGHGEESFVRQYEGFVPPGGHKNFGAILETIFGNPGFIANTVLDHDKLQYVLLLLVPLLFLPVTRPIAALLVVPGFVFTLLSTGYEPLYRITFQYTSYWTAFFFIGLVLALERAAPGRRVPLAAGIFRLDPGVLVPLRRLLPARDAPWRLRPIPRRYDDGRPRAPRQAGERHRLASTGWQGRRLGGRGPPRVGARIRVHAALRDLRRRLAPLPGSDLARGEGPNRRQPHERHLRRRGRRGGIRPGPARRGHHGERSRAVTSALNGADDRLSFQGAMGFPLRCASYVLMVALAVLAHAFTAPRLTGVEVRQGGGPWKNVQLPYSAPTGHGTLEFRAHLWRGRLGPRSIAIVPDDHFESLWIDDVAVPLEEVPPAKLADWRFGFTVRIAPYLHPGDNVIVAGVRNEGGPGGLDLRGDPYEWPLVVELVAGIGGLLALAAELLRRFRVPWPSITVVLAAVVVHVAYLAVTPDDLRHHDAQAHLEYIEYLVDHRALPKPEQGYMFYQPPLYYVLSALQWTGLRAIGAGRPLLLWSLQVQSVVVGLGFALLSIATARLWVRRVPAAGFGRGVGSERWSEALLAALVLLWPSGIVHAVRIGNDDLAYLFFAGSFYFTCRWWVLGIRRDVAWASLLAGLGVLTKVNDIVAFAVLLLAVVGRLALLEHDRRILEYGRRVGIATACLVASVAASLGVAVRDWLAGRREHLLASNANHNTTNLALLSVGNHLQNYLWLDVPTFLKQPFTSPWEDAKGRQWFWNYLLKTSLFGEFDYTNPWLGRLGIVISALLLVLLVQLVAGALLVRRRQWLDEMPLVASVVLWLASLAALRFSAPSSCSNDFRYILPVILPCAYAYVRTQTRCRERGWRIVPGASAVVGWLFVLSSIAFFGVLALLGG